MQQAEALDDLVRILIVEDRGETARRFAEVLAKEPRFAVCAVAGSVAAANNAATATEDLSTVLKFTLVSPSPNYGFGVTPFKRFGSPSSMASSAV